MGSKAKKISTTQRSKYWERGFGLEARKIEKTLGENYKSTSDRTTQRSKYRERGFGLEAREIEKTLGQNYKSTSDRLFERDTEMRRSRRC
ncbi:hypothetical protein MANES_12G147201v8 [Manihot esculenta]|uniref:Uncharacterized protein n=1 Tax=Manihot esculenta TaxID=3983 RepID=A0ACB7GRW8_MANES|nr:hypothetical protein MANES_12G147201v8 [Manihot esculenta]